MILAVSYSYYVTSVQNSFGPIEDIVTHLNSLFQACSQQAVLLEHQHKELKLLHAWMRRHADWEVAQWMQSQWKLPILPEVSTTPLTSQSLSFLDPWSLTLIFPLQPPLRIRQEHPEEGGRNGRGAAPADPSNSSSWEPVSLTIPFAWLGLLVHATRRS